MTLLIFQSENVSHSLSCVWLFVTPWTVAHQAPLYMEFSRQEYWSGLPFPSLGDLPDPSRPIAGRFFTIFGTRWFFVALSAFTLHQKAAYWKHLKLCICRLFFFSHDKKFWGVKGYESTPQPVEGMMNGKLVVSCSSILVPQSEQFWGVFYTQAFPGGIKLQFPQK